MALCPACNNELSGQPQACPICGHELESESDSGDEYCLLGSFDDRPTAELAKEALNNSDIPAVLISRAGFFGSAGLTMNPFYNSEQAAFELSVPESKLGDAGDLLDSVLGDNWRRR